MPLLKTAGRFDATVRTCEIDEPPGKDATVRLTLDTTEGEITTWLSLRTVRKEGSDKSAFDISLKTLREAFGFDDDFPNLAAQVQGKACSIVTEMETYEGKERCRVKWVNPVVVAPKVSTLSTLSALAKKTPRPAGAPAPKPQPKAAPAQNTPVADEDVPF
jgi:hypothetical protein